MNPIVLSIPVFFLLIGLEVLYDRIKHRNLYRLNDAFANISCGIFEQLTGVFSKVFTIALYALVYENLRWFSIPNTWYWLVILFLAIDLVYYWAHRMSHEVNLFWIGHVVHHQSEEYNLSVALRQGAFQKVFTAVFYLPLALAGFSVEYFLLWSAVNTLYQFWIHTETIRSLGPLEYVLNTPSHHRVHHGRNPKYIDRNHAGIFIIWDKLFGTFQKEEEPPVYGITTPTRTWDAVTAHLRPFQNLASDWKSIKEWKYRLLLLIKKPGWLPAQYGGYRKPAAVFPETYVKFETRLNREMNGYLIVHFLLILAGTSFLLFNLEQLATRDQITFAMLIIISTMTAGFLFEGKPWGKWMETARLLFSGTLLWYFFRDHALGTGLWICLAVIVTASVFWILHYYSASTPVEYGNTHPR